MRTHLPRVIFLEFDDATTGKPRVVGTDAIYHVDRRKSHENVVRDIQDRADSTIFTHRNLTLAGYSLPGDYSDRIKKF